MPDEADIANDYAEQELDRQIQRVRRQSGDLELYQGRCMDCGEWSSSIRRGTSLCAACRSREEARRGRA